MLGGSLVIFRHTINQSDDDCTLSHARAFYSIELFVCIFRGSVLAIYVLSFCTL